MLAFLDRIWLWNNSIDYKGESINHNSDEIHLFIIRCSYEREMKTDFCDVNFWTLLLKDNKTFLSIINKPQKYWSYMYKCRALFV